MQECLGDIVQFDRAFVIGMETLSHSRPSQPSVGLSEVATTASLDSLGGLGILIAVCPVDGCTERSADANAPRGTPPATSRDQYLAPPVETELASRAIGGKSLDTLARPVFRYPFTLRESALPPPMSGTRCLVVRSDASRSAERDGLRFRMAQTGLSIAPQPHLLFLATRRELPQRPGRVVATDAGPAIKDDTLIIH